MWQPRDAHTIIQAAEKAAAAGNLASAENLLRDAARLQEANLGPRHPDLANTLNNLGIVCEMTGKPTEAEQYFRRAVSIARTSLEPDHPFVTTSQKNLQDFCDARGKQVELPAPLPRVAEPPPEPPASVDERSEDPEATSKKFFTRMALGALGPIAMLMVVLAVGLPRLGAPELASPSAAIATGTRRDVAPSPVDAIPAHEETATKPGDEDAGARVIDDTPTSASARSASAASASATSASATSASAASARPVVVRASLCGDLVDWSCDPADDPVPSGPLYFYTRITAMNITTVQHRWYQDNRLLQTVELQVQPTAAGYRTYSRNIMKSESAGHWRVEVRTDDGALLHEERFTVR